MTETILRLLTRLSEAGDDAILPGEHATPFFGPAFDRLLAKRVLVEQAPLADWDVCDNCECGLPCRPIRKAGGGFRAECPLNRRQDVVLTAADLRVFRIGAAELASTLAIAAGFGAPARPAADRVWRLGDLPSGRVAFLALETSAIAAEGIATTLRHAAQGSEITILAPGLPADLDRRLRDAGFHLVETLAAWHGQSCCAVSVSDEHRALETALARLPAEDRRLCAALADRPVSGLAAAGFGSRSALYRRLADLRHVLTAHGLGPAWDDLVAA